MTASHVRHIPSGLCASARYLGFDARPPQNSWHRGKVRTYRPNSRISKLTGAEELVQLVLSGQTYREIADRFGVKLEDSVKRAYERARRLVAQQMREKGSTWEEIRTRFSLGKQGVHV
jgi:hypothetical protein